MEIDDTKFVDLLQRWLEAVRNLAAVQEALNREGWDFFVGRIGAQNRITIPSETMKALNLRESDEVVATLILLTKKEGK